MKFEEKDNNLITGLNIEVGRIGKNIDEWENKKDYERIILEAWREDPRNTNKLYNEEILIEELENRLKNYLKKELFFLFAKIDNEIAGSVGIYFENDLEQRIAKIIDFHICKEYREKGVGTQLFAEMLDKVKQETDSIKIQLNVNNKNETAKKIYAAQGFEVIEKEKGSLILEKRL